LAIQDAEVLAANYQVQTELLSKGIQSKLWEECLSNSDFRSLHLRLKSFCNSWFLSSEYVDFSSYQGLSFGKAISNYLAYDLESWVRIAAIFESIGILDRDVDLYVPNRGYFPSVVYDYVERIELHYNCKISIRSLEIEDLGLESSVAHVVSQRRCTSELKRSSRSTTIALLDWLKKFITQRKSSSVRCLVVRIRNSGEYFSRDEMQKNQGLHLFFDTHYFVQRRMFFDDLRSHRLTFLDKEMTTNGFAGEETFRLQFQLALDSLHDCLASSLGLNSLGHEFILNLVRPYLDDAMDEQMKRFQYLSRQCAENKINATICDGPDSPESHYCRHLMTERKGTSYFVPHGLIRKDQTLEPWRGDLADIYFYYTESLKGQLSKQYSINENRFHSLRFLSTVSSAPKLTETASHSVLILLDNFQVALISRINYFGYLQKVIEIFRTNGVSNITVRLSQTFLRHYHKSRVSEEDQVRYFAGVTIQYPAELQLESVISDYDIVIGPLTTCILEAILHRTFFIPFIPDYFLHEESRASATMQWMPELYPDISSNFDQLQEVVSSFVMDPTREQRKYEQSIEAIGLCMEKTESIVAIVSKNRNLT